jgi:hypothetical protein
VPHDVLEESTQSDIDFLINHFNEEKKRKSLVKNGDPKDEEMKTDEKNSAKPLIQANRIRYFIFRPFQGNMRSKMEQPLDRGYFFRFLNGEVRLIENLLKDNGFRETNQDNFTLLWSIGPIKQEIYSTLQHFQKVVYKIVVKLTTFKT